MNGNTAPAVFPLSVALPETWFSAGARWTTGKDLEMISMTCPHCHEALQIPKQYAGQSGACTKCGARIQVPAGEDPGGFGAGSGPPDDLAAAIEASFSATPKKPLVVAPTLGDRLQPLLKPLGPGLGVIALVAAVIVGGAYLPAPRLGGGPSPEEVTRGFMEASKSGSMQQCEPYVTAKAWELLRQAPQMAANMPALESYTVGAAAVSGGNAEVPVAVNQMGMTVTNNVLLRQESGAWRVYGVRVNPMPGMNMTMNFENPEAMMEEAQTMMENMTPAMMEEMMKGMMPQGG